MFRNDFLNKGNVCQRLGSRFLSFGNDFPKKGNGFPRLRRAFLSVASPGLLLEMISKGREMISQPKETPSFGLEMPPSLEKCPGLLLEMISQPRETSAKLLFSSNALV